MPSTSAGPKGSPKVKGELLDALPPDGLAMLDAATAAGPEQRARSAAPVVTVGRRRRPTSGCATSCSTTRSATVRAGTPWGSGDSALAVRGAHQAATRRWPPPSRSSRASLRRGRRRARRRRGVGVADGAGHDRRRRHRLNDAYNASPVATHAALDALAALPVAAPADRGVRRDARARRVERGEHRAHRSCGVAAGSSAGRGRCGHRALVAAATDAAGPRSSVHRVPDADAPVPRRRLRRRATQCSSRRAGPSASRSWPRR